jgi:photosystem II stability/assembly factor-like uncharacterized protein
MKIGEALLFWSRTESGRQGMVMTREESMNASRSHIWPLVFVSIFVVSEARAQWIQTNGPEEGQVNRILVSGSNIFAGTETAGVFRSTDGGATWRPANSGLAFMKVNDLAAIENSLFAAGNGISVSTDFGDSWTSVAMTNINVLLLATIGKKLFAAAQRYGVFRSTDNGRSWTDVNWGLQFPPYCMATTGTHLFAVTYGGAFRLGETDTSWVPTAYNGTGAYVAHLAASGSTVLGAFAGNIILTTDNGTSWTKASADLAGESVVDFAIDGAYFYTATRSGVFSSTNGGTSWTKVSPFMALNGLLLAVDSPNLFAATHDEGVFRSTDRGMSWSAVNTGMLLAEVRVLATMGTNLCAVTRSDKVFLTADAGQSWTRLPEGVYSVHDIAATPAGLLAGDVNGLWRLTNGSATWVRITHLATNSIVVRGDTLFAGTQHGVFFSSNAGVDWISIGLTSADVSKLVQGDAFILANIYLGVEGPGGIWRLTTGETSWAPVTSRSWFSGLMARGTDVLAADAYEPSSIFLSTNSGTSWTNITSRLPIGANISTIAASETNYFAGGNGVFLSTDRGVSWIDTGFNQSPAPVISFAVNATTLYAGTRGSGVWRRPLAEMVTAVDASQHSMPASFKLDQNFPNPFNPNTVIRYSIPEQGHVSLAVFDLLGREVVRLVDGVMPRGDYSVTLDGSTLSSGVYCYRLITGQHSLAKSMILLK